MIRRWEGERMGIDTGREAENTISRIWPLVYTTTNTQTYSPGSRASNPHNQSRETDGSSDGKDWLADS